MGWLEQGAIKFMLHKTLEFKSWQKQTSANQGISTIKHNAAVVAATVAHNADDDGTSNDDDVSI